MSEQNTLQHFTRLFPFRAWGKSMATWDYSWSRLLAERWGLGTTGVKVSKINGDPYSHYNVNSHGAAIAARFCMYWYLLLLYIHVYTTMLIMITSCSVLQVDSALGIMLQVRIQVQTISLCMVFKINGWVYIILLSWLEYILWIYYIHIIMCAHAYQVMCIQRPHTVKVNSKGGK